jgi:ribosomal protein S24E
MNIENLTQEKNELLARTCVRADVSFTGATPSRVDVTKQLASKLKADEALVRVETIHTAYGHSSSKVMAYVYDTPEAKKRWEPKPKKK